MASSREELAAIQEQIRNTTTLNELQRIANDLNSEDLKLLKETIASRRELLERNQERLVQLKSEVDFLKLIGDGTREVTSEQRDYLKIIEEFRSVREGQLSKELELVELQIRQKKQLFEQEFENAKEGMEGDAERAAAIQKHKDEIEELIKKQKRLNLAKQEETNANDVAGESFSNLMNIVGVKTEKQKLTMVEALAVGQFNQEELNQQVADFATSGLAAQRIMASFGAKFIESTIAMMKQMDTLMADMFKLTGGSVALRERFAELADRAGSSGVAFKTMGESITSLMKNSSNFTELTKEQAEAVASNNAQLIALGVSADTAGKNFSTFTQSLGMSIEQANSASRQLVSLAHNLQMSYDEISSGFASTANTFAAYGPMAVKEFSKLAAESKALGISMEQLIGIVKGADTFQGAAEQAGKLNAMLGGGLLNSSQLLVASESERIQLLRDAVMQTGRSFETMSKYEQIAFANAAGIQDLTVAQKLFNQQVSGNELEIYLGKTNALGQSQEQMKAQALAAQSAQEKFAIVMEQFAASMEPVVSLLGNIMSVMVLLSPLIKTLATVFILLTTIKYGLIVPYKAISAAMAAQTAAAATNTAATVANAAATEAVGAASKRTIGSIFASGVAIAAAGVRALGASVYTFLFGSSLNLAGAAGATTAMSLGLVVIALLALFAVMHLAGSPMLYAIFGFVALGILFMGESAEKNRKGLLAFGAAMLMVGTGAFLAFHGLEGFSKALSSLDSKQLFALVVVLGLLAISLIALFAAVLYVGTPAIVPLLALGAAMSMIGLGVGIAGAGMSLFVESLSKLTLESIGAIIGLSLALGLLTVSLISMGASFIYFAMPIMGAIGMIQLLAATINSIEPEKSIALKTTVDSIKDIATASTQLTTENVDNLEKVVDQIHRFNVEATVNKMLNITAPFEELINAIVGQTGAVTAAANSKQQTNVVMKLNDREFGKAVVDVLNERGTSNTIIKKA